MEYIDVIYGRSNWKPISVLIQIRTLSWWSHIGAIVDGKVIESVGGQGVVTTDLPDFIARYSSVDFKRLPVLDKQYAIDYLKGKVGRPYDKKAALGYLFMLGWDDKDAEHCSELIAGSTQLFNKGKIHKVTPGDLRNLSK